MFSQSVDGLFFSSSTTRNARPARGIATYSRITKEKYEYMVVEEFIQGFIITEILLTCFRGARLFGTDIGDE